MSSWIRTARSSTSTISSGLARVEATRSLSRVLVDRSFDTVSWLRDLGVRWEFARTAVEARDVDSGKLGLQLGAAVRTRGKGPALSDTLFGRAREAGVEVLYGAQATGLVMDNGTVRGVEVTMNGSARTIDCAAVVLACGGFESSTTLRSRFLGEAWGAVKVRGTQYNGGEMLLAALEAGAGSAGDWSECHATPIAADSPAYGDLGLGAETNRLSYPYGVMLNLHGKRFADEGEDFKLYTYAKLGVDIMRQPGGIGLQIFDAKVGELLEPRYHHTEPLRAASLDELGAKLEDEYGARGLRGDAVLRTIGEYNAASNGGTFDPIRLDGLRTNGLSPDKTNWARPIDTPPFTVYPVTTGITFTFGGVRVGPDAAVLRDDGHAIGGLYASGEITGGFFHANYPAGAGLMRGAVFGRLAGEGAAATALGR